MDKEILELLKTIQGDISSLKDDISSMKDDIKRLDNKVDKRFDELASEIGDLVSKDIATGISNQITEVKTDIGFIKHKLNTTEEDVYKIQSHLKLIK